MPGTTQHTVHTVHLVGSIQATALYSIHSKLSCHYLRVTHENDDDELFVVVCVTGGSETLPTIKDDDDSSRVDPMHPLDVVVIHEDDSGLVLFHYSAVNEGLDGESHCFGGGRVQIQKQQPQVEESSFLSG